MEIKTFAVIGAGQMGTGIAQVAASKGYEVVLNSTKDVSLEKAMHNIVRGLDKSVEKGKLSPEERDTMVKKIRVTTRLGDIAHADFVIESVVEDERVKINLFRQLEEICRPEVILATNTSSVSLAKLAGVTKRPEKVIGMHFMYPPVQMKLVEIIRGLVTSDETFHVVKDLAVKLGKTPIETKDLPCFVTSRVIQTMINEAIYCLYEGISTKEDIDTALKLGMNHPMGPLELADFIGLDVVLAMQQSLYEGFKDTKYRPCPLLSKYVEAGFLGRKTGRGFYQYDEKGEKIY
jgi:3-hydroxybutyryl-CoA dehydrogenase